MTLFSVFLCQSYISKGIRLQGIGSSVRNSYVSTPCPVVICPYLFTSEVWAAFFLAAYCASTVLGDQHPASGGSTCLTLLV